MLILDAVNLFRYARTPPHDLIEEEWMRTRLFRTYCSELDGLPMALSSEVRGAWRW